MRRRAIQSESEGVAIRGVKKSKIWISGSGCAKKSRTDAKIDANINSKMELKGNKVC